jgi:NADH dehydrogenase FAD-containing subunit
VSSQQPGNGKPQTRVVIVGGGFAGIGCAKELAGEDAVHVTLIDQHNYHQFQPLLYQVATSQLSATDIAASLRKTFHDDDNVDVKLAEVTEVDPPQGTPTPATCSCSQPAPRRTSSTPQGPPSTAFRCTP